MNATDTRATDNFDATDEMDELETTDGTAVKTGAGDTEITVQRMAEDLVLELNSDEITPYKIHAVINALLEAFGSDVRIRPQMIYNYDRNGMIVKGKKDAKRYTTDEVVAFAVRHVNKRLANAA